MGDYFMLVSNNGSNLVSNQTQMPVSSALASNNSINSNPNVYKSDNMIITLLPAGPTLPPPEPAPRPTFGSFLKSQQGQKIATFLGCSTIGAGIAGSFIGSAMGSAGAGLALGAGIGLVAPIAAAYIYMKFFFHS